MGFFDLQLTPEELARSQTLRYPTPRGKEASFSPRRNCQHVDKSKPRLKEIIRRPLALVWINPTFHSRQSGENEHEDGSK